MLYIIEVPPTIVDASSPRPPEPLVGSVQTWWHASTEPVEFMKWHEFVGEGARILKPRPNFGEAAYRLAAF